MFRNISTFRPFQIFFFQLPSPTKFEGGGKSWELKGYADEDFRKVISFFSL